MLIRIKNTSCQKIWNIAFLFLIFKNFALLSKIINKKLRTQVKTVL